MLNYEYPPLGGGASPVSYEIAMRLAKKGHKIDLVTMGFKGLDRIERNGNLTIHRVKCLRSKKEICHPHEMLSFVISGYLYCRKLVKKNKYDINYTHFIIPTGIISYKLWKEFGLPYVITSHGSDVIGYNARFKKLYPVLKPLWNKIVLNAKKIVTPSEFLKKEILKQVSVDNIVVIPNGIDSDKIKPLKKEKYILLCSRLFVNKGVQDFLLAVKDLDLGEWKIKIVGDGPYIQKLLDLRHKYDLDDKVEFLGWVENDSEEYKMLVGSASIFCSPSYFESFGMTVIEAMQADCKLLLSDISAFKELKEYHNVHYFKTKDVNDLTLKIRQLINSCNNTSKIEKPVNLIEKYCWGNILSNYEDMLIKSKRNKKITIVFPKDSSAIFVDKSTETFGGATVQIFSLAKELCNYDNLDVSCLTVDFGRKDGEVVKGLKIFNTFHKNDNLLVRVFKFHKAIHRVRSDVVIQRGLTSFSCLLAVYCKMFGIKYVYMFASDVEADGCYQRTNKKVLLFNLLIKYSDLMISQNKYQHQKILKDYNRKTNILYSGFPVKKSSDINREFILWVGRAEQLKNPLKFIHLASINPSHKFVMICNNIVGQKKYFDKIKHLADDVKNIEFISYVPFNKIDSYFGSAKLLVNTSDYEGFPNIFVQAAMNKVPIVSLNVNPDHFITKYNCGVFCDGNEALMNQSVQDLLMDSKKRNDLSINAYNYARENHDIRKNARVLYDLIFNE